MSSHPTPYTLRPLPWTELCATHPRIARLLSSPAARSDGHKENDVKYRSGFSIHSRPARAIAAPASRGPQLVPVRDIAATDRTRTRFGSRYDPLRESIAAA